MNINKQEAERILKSVQQNKVTAVTLRKNDTQQNKRQELMRLQRMVESKIPLGEEITVVVLETNQSRKCASSTCIAHFKYFLAEPIRKVINHFLGDR